MIYLITSPNAAVRRSIKAAVSRMAGRDDSILSRCRFETVRGQGVKVLPTTVADEGLIKASSHDVLRRVMLAAGTTAIEIECR